MTALAPTLQAFFVTRLGRERDASPNTVDSYRHAFRLLLAYARDKTGKHPSELDFADLDADLDLPYTPLHSLRTRLLLPPASVFGGRPRQ